MKHFCATFTFLVVLSLVSCLMFIFVFFFKPIHLFFTVFPVYPIVGLMKNDFIILSFLNRLTKVKEQINKT